MVRLFVDLDLALEVFLQLRVFRKLELDDRLVFAATRDCEVDWSATVVDFAIEVRWRREPGEAEKDLKIGLAMDRLSFSPARLFDRDR